LKKSNETKGVGQKKRGIRGIPCPLILDGWYRLWEGRFEKQKKGSREEKAEKPGKGGGGLM